VKVTKLHIDEYKVFKDFDIDFTNEKGEDQNLIVLAGINGTGKTTLLKFIFNTINNRRESIAETNSYIVLAKYTFSDYNKIFYKAQNDGIYIYYDQETEPDYESFNNGVLFFRVKQYYLSYSLQPISDNDVIIKFIDHCIYEEKISPSDAYEALRVYLDRLADAFSLGFKFKRLTGHKVALFVNQRGEEIPIDDLSTGERQIISLLLQLYVANIKNSIILIDEPEFSLHPSWQNKIVGVLQKYANEYNCQAILATHSPHIIGSVHPEQLRLLYKDEDGAIKVAEHMNGSYGWRVEKILMEIMGVELRNPQMQSDLDKLSAMIASNKYDTPEFEESMNNAIKNVGFTDRDLTLMRFEIAKRKKESAANK
jgi:ABC-type Mn2+/Zn2+ transport system ATPase subunit